MKNKAKQKIIAFVWFLFSAVMTYVAWDKATAMAALLADNGTAITFLQVLYWIGLLTIWLINILVIPVLVANTEEGGFRRVWDGMRGLLAFIMGTMGSLVIYWVLPNVMQTLENVTGFTIVTTIGWFAIILCWILLMVVVPIFIGLETFINLEDVVSGEE